MTGTHVERLSTGIEGFDEVLQGGLIPGRNYLVRGEPGTGKTVLGLHFLTEGVAAGDTSLFINLEESVDDLRTNARTLGLDLDGVEFLDMSPESDVFVENESYDLLAPSEVEQEPFVDDITETVEAVDPDRVFVDPLTQLRYLASDDHQFRKQVIGFMRFLKERGATVLYTSQDTEATPDDDLQFMSDGTIHLRYTEMGHAIEVPKFRGSAVVDGHHAMAIDDGGISVYPELRPTEHDQPYSEGVVSSGVPELDELLDGGFERGTVSVLSGPTGVGKTTLGTQFMKEAAGRGERSVAYLFEESPTTFRARSEAVNIPVQEMEERGTLSVRGMEPLQLSPQEFASQVRAEVEENDTSLVMIDGVSGYQLAIRGDEMTLVRKLHALARYLKNMGVTVIMVDETSAITGEFSASEVGISYLADNIVFLRHLEYRGELRKVIGVLKMRMSDYEQTLRRMQITEHGLKVGEPLTGLSGILSGTPDWTDADESGRAADERGRRHTDDSWSTEVRGTGEAREPGPRDTS